MKTVRELLLDADPLQQERTPSLEKRDLVRRSVLATVSDVPVQKGNPRRLSWAVFATVGLVVIAASFLGAKVWSLFFNDLQVQAAVHFEVRLAEDRPGPGLREAKVADSDRKVYLHDEIIVSNSDIATAHVVQGSGTSEYSVNIDFNPSGTEKMLKATKDHIGKPVAILLDGQVVAAPLLRTPIGPHARITGRFSRTQAERIVNGIRIQ
jgi:hypothetical protein